jgi:hypothetical protein
VHSDKKPLKLGELLITAGLLTTEELNSAIKKASETSLPIGKVLTMGGSISDHALQGAIQAQSMLKDKHLEADAAIAALKVIVDKNVTLQEALRQLGEGDKRDGKTVKLGEILAAAQLVTESDVKEALRSSEETGLPLGRILVLTKNLSEEMVSAALTAQVLIRDGKVTLDQAIDGLKAARQRRVSIETALADRGYFRPPPKQRIKLGELYMLAELILETDLMVSLERGLVNHKPIGQVFLESGLTKPEILDAALSLQEMVANNSLNPLQAAQALRQVALQRHSLAQALAEIQSANVEPDDPFRLGSILQAAGIISHQDIQKALDLSVKNSALFGRMLQSAGIVNDELLNSSLRAQYLLREGIIGLEQAIIALNQCRQTGQTFDQVMAQLGWTFPTRTKA